MKVISSILIMFIVLVGCKILISCGESNVEVKSTEYRLAPQSRVIKIVTIEGCEYIWGDWGNATVLTHKGNCVNHKDTVK